METWYKLLKTNQQLPSQTSRSLSRTNCSRREKLIWAFEASPSKNTRVKMDQIQVEYLITVFFNRKTFGNKDRTFAICCTYLFNRNENASWDKSRVSRTCVFTTCSRMGYLDHAGGPVWRWMSRGFREQSASLFTWTKWLQVIVFKCQQRTHAQLERASAYPNKLAWPAWNLSQTRDQKTKNRAAKLQDGRKTSQ